MDSLGFLRSLTVLMVCFRHYGKPLAYSNIFPGLFRAFNTDGGFSVQVFFVMSGFIVPYSFNKGKYALGDFFLFLKKRFWRLYPPYLAALALTLVISYFSYKIRHLPNPETLLSITKSLFWLHFPADNPVFWTLKIEAQYYGGIGLFYIALIRRPSIALFLGIPIILSISLTSLTAYISLLNYIGFFLFGTIGFLIYSQKGNMTQNWIALCMVFLFSGFVYKLPAFVAATGALVFILSYRKPIPAWLQFPGKISYSIYLIHFVLGIKIINFLKAKIDPSYNWALFLGTLIIVIVSSWLFYNVFEVFSQNISKQIKYRAATNHPRKVTRDAPVSV